MKDIIGPRLVGIIGDPLAQSLSPLIHNAAFQHLGLDYSYVPFPVRREQLADAIKGLRALNFVGCNVTIPYKEEIIPLLDDIDPKAQNLGAVNTIVNRDGRLWGYNTDGLGFLRSLTAAYKINLVGKEALILGAGGGARAVAFALAEAGLVKLGIANRSFGKAQILSEEILARTDCLAIPISLEEQYLQKILASADILINTLPLGMYPQAEQTPPIKAEWLQPPLIVCDLIYNPIKTKLLKIAKQRNCQILNGEGMLVYQGAEGFRLWTEVNPPIEVMKKTLRKQLLR